MTDRFQQLVKDCYECVFQAIWRQIQNLGLSVAYSSDDRIKEQVRDQIALAFAPLPLIDATFQTLETTCDPRLTPLFLYFRNEWMRPGFKRVWNVSGLDIRTNNNVEGWHNRFANAIGKHHPNIWEFLLVVQNEQANTEVELQQMAAGGRIVRNKRKYVRVAKAVKTLRRRYRRGHLNTLQFIRGISNQLKRY